jgi:hypothetical protein
MKKKWTKARCKELELMRHVLIESMNLNRGSHVTDRILRLEKMATKLDLTNFGTGRLSFYQFLVGLAADERRPKRVSSAGTAK